MASPSPQNLREFGERAQELAERCKNERLAMTMQYVALGSMILMGLASAVHVFKDLVRVNEHPSRTR